MAGDWIKFEVSTLDKPEVWAIATELQIDPDAVVGKLLRVWAWFDSHSVDGNAASVTSALLDRYCSVTGFVRAMINCGWMVEHDGILSLPNFDRHNGQTAKKRILTAKRVSNHKKGNADGNAKGNAASVTLSVSDALPKEEKRREEKNKEDSLAVASPVGGKKLQFPTSDGEFWEADQKTQQTLRDAFPNLNHGAEAKKALAWLETNPTKRKTAKGMPRFLNSWFNRASKGLSDSGRSGSAAAAAPERRAGIYDPTNAMPTAEVLRARRKAREAAEAAQRASLEATA